MLIDEFTNPVRHRIMRFILPVMFLLLPVTPLTHGATLCAPAFAEIDEFNYKIWGERDQMVIRVEVPAAYRNLTFERFDLGFSREEAVTPDSSRAIALENQKSGERVAAEFEIKGDIHRYYFLRAFYTGGCTNLLLLEFDPAKAAVKRLQ